MPLKSIAFLILVSYVRTNALLYEYYKQARELIPEDIGGDLHKLFNSEEFMIVNTRLESIENDISSVFHKMLETPLPLTLTSISLVLRKFWAMSKLKRMMQKADDTSKGR